MEKGEILLIEDESAIAQNIIYALKTEGYTTTWTKRGYEGLKHLTSRTRLVLLDIGLPDINGFDVCKKIRSRCEVPIIFITARQGDVDLVLGLELGGDDYIIKPFSPRALVARVRARLRRTTLTIDQKPLKEARGVGFAVDESRKQITFMNTKLELTRYEYLLLQALIKEPGRVFSRRQLMEKACSEPDSSLERTIDAHIKSLRKKVKKVYARQEIILTHRGLGYSLREY